VVGIPVDVESVMLIPRNPTSSLPGGRLGKAKVTSIATKKAITKIITPPALISPPSPVFQYAPSLFCTHYPQKIVVPGILISYF